MTRFPATLADAVVTPGLRRAGGTDLTERRHLGIAPGDVVDLRDVPGLASIEPRPDGGLSVGAAVPIAALADDPRVKAGWPALAEAAGGLATPQIRARGTVGGSLLQDVRCWYYRTAAFTCLKKGGTECLARGGDNLFHSAFDQGPCAAPHPSTLGMALMAYDASVEVAGADGRTVAQLLGDGRDATRTHTLPPGAVLTAIVLPPPLAGERGAYFRAIHRARAEWPLVEVLARLQVVDGRIQGAWVAVGGVANTPLRLPQVERALIGLAAEGPALTPASDKAADGARPLSMTAYKVPLIQASVQEALERALGAEAGGAP